MTHRLLIDCKGAGYPGNLSNGWHANCAMCNARLPLDDDGNLTPHKDLDVLAMIDSGLIR